jgi:hypothetical protein
MKRFENNEFDIDLVYIYDKRIICCSDGDFGQLSSFLLSNHIGRYRIFNFTFKNLIEDALDTRVVERCSFDATYPPPLNFIERIIENAESWLSLHKLNTVYYTSSVSH